MPRLLQILVYLSHMQARPSLSFQNHLLFLILHSTPSLSSRNWLTLSFARTIYKKVGFSFTEHVGSAS